MLINFAISVGEIMLKNGAETHRVEDTVERILAVEDGRMPETFVTPTGIFVSIHGNLTGTVTKMRRVSDHSINLEKITMANSLSRAFVSGEISLQEGFAKLEQINNLKSFPNKLVVFCYGSVCWSFALLFNGSLLDSLGAFVIGSCLGLFILFLGQKKVTPFIRSLLSGSFITLFSLALSRLTPLITYEIIILGLLMPLVPGVAITNSVRDVMNRDYLSGACRMLEASVIAVAVATGVGVTLSLFAAL